MSHIYIPIRQTDEHVAIPVDQLPNTDPKDLIRVLVRERVPLEIWLRLATEYRKVGREDAFETMIQMATGAKQRRGYQSVSQYSHEGRHSGGRVMSNDEEMSLTQEWMRTRAHGDYETSVSTAMLFDAMSAHLIQSMMSMMSIGAEKNGRSAVRNLSEAQREKAKRDLATEATWYLQQAESVEKQKFVGASSEWYHHLVAGMQYYCKKDDSKASAEFKNSLSLFESRAARLGQALVLIRALKYVEALEELSRVYTSIYASYKEDFSAHHVDGLVPSSQGSRGRYVNDRDNATSDYEWFKSHDGDVRAHVDRSVKLEFLSTYATLRPLMALVWFKLGSTQRAIEVLKLQLESVEEGMNRGLIGVLPPHHDATLAMLGVLELNKNSEMMQRAKSVEDVEVAATFLRDALEHFKRAFQLNPDNPNVLNHLSNIFFTQKKHEERDWDKIDGFASRAKELAQQAGWKEICAESCYYLGRSAHARGKSATARQFYLDSLVFSHTFPLPRYALAQLSFGEKDYAGAIDHLTKLDSKVPDLPDTKAFLGKIHLLLSQAPASPTEYQSHYSAAAKLLARAIQLNPALIAPHMDLAQLKERTSPQESLSSYLLASDLIYQQFLAQSGIDLDEYKKTASDMYEYVVNPEADGAKIVSPTLYPSFMKRFQLLAPRTVYNNVSVMRMTNGAYTEAKDSILRTILLGACTLGAADVSTVSSKSSSFVNPTTYAESSSSTLDAPLVFSALFGRSLREPLPANALSLIETFVLETGVFKLPLNLTAAYNLGLIYEKLGDARSERVYESLLERYPHYLDAKLRLAIVKRDLGQGEDAEKLLKAIMSDSSETSTKNASPALQTHRENSKSLAGVVLANMLMARKELKETQTMLDALVNKMSSKAAKGDSPAVWTFGCDVYSLTQYANFFLATSYASPNREKNLKWASSLFASVLKQTPGNIYAANGLAIITALQAKDEMSTPEDEKATSSEKSVKWNDKSRSAMNAFLAIREACPNLPDVLINLGHLSFCVGDFRGAAKHYQMAWTKLGGASSAVIKSGQVTPMLARCLYEMGHFDQAKLILESQLLPKANDMDIDASALAEDKDEDLWFNLAVMCKEWAMQILQRVDLSLSSKANKSSYETEDSNGKEGESGDKTSMDVEGGRETSMDVDQTSSSVSASGRSSTPSKKQQDFQFLSAPSEEEQKKAIDMLRYAKPIFDRLSRVNADVSEGDSTKKMKKISFSTKKCGTLSRICEMNAELAEEKLKVYRDEMEAEKAAREEKRRVLELEESAALEKTKMEEEALMKQLEEQNAVAEALRLKSQQMMEDWVSSGGAARDEDTRRSSKSKKKSSSGRRSAYEDEMEEDNNESILARSKRSTSNSKRAAESGSGAQGGVDEEEDEEKEFEPEDDDEDDGYWNPVETGKSEKKKAPPKKKGRQPASLTAGDDDAEEEESASASATTGTEDKRKSQLEELAARRNAAKRAHSEVEDASTATETATTASAATNADESAPSTKKRKLKDNKEKGASPDDDKDDIEGLDL